MIVATQSRLLAERVRVNFPVILPLVAVACIGW